MLDYMISATHYIAEVTISVLFISQVLPIYISLVKAAAELLDNDVQEQINENINNQVPTGSLVMAMSLCRYFH